MMLSKSGRGMGMSRQLGLLIVVVLAACTLGSVPVRGEAGATWIPGSANVSAYRERAWTSFPRKDGIGNVSMTTPMSFAKDSEGRLFVADFDGGVVLVLDPEYRVEAIIGASDHATIQAPGLETPRDVTVDSKDRIYICDSGAKKIHILDSDLEYLGSIPVSHPTQPGRPMCVAVDSQDRLIVGDYRTQGESRIMVFVEDEKNPTPESMILLKVFQFNPPDEDRVYACGIPIEIAVDSQNRIIVAEGSSLHVADRERLIIFDKDFQWVSTLGSKGYLQGQFVQIQGVTVGPGDMIIGADLAGSVSFFFQNGTYAGWIGGPSLTGFENCLGLLVTNSRTLLVGETHPGKINEVRVGWDSLRAHPVGEPLCGFIVVLVVCFQTKIGCYLREG